MLARRGNSGSALCTIFRRRVTARYNLMSSASAQQSALAKKVHSGARAPRHRDVQCGNKCLRRGVQVAVCCDGVQQDGDNRSFTRHYELQLAVQCFWSWIAVGAGSAGVSRMSRNRADPTSRPGAHSLPDEARCIVGKCVAVLQDSNAAPAARHSHVELHDQRLWKEKCGQRQQAVAVGDATGEVRAWKLFLLLAFMLLHRPVGEGRVGKEELSNRFDKVSDGQWGSSQMKLSSQLRARDHGCQD